MSTNNDRLEKEYYSLLDLVNKFDDRLVTVKSWSVTLSLAALGSGFQFQHYGLFVVASLSGLGFWLIETLMKGHQMRYYARMRQIEVAIAESLPSEQRLASSPQIDWGWSQAVRYFKGEPPTIPQWYSGTKPHRSYKWSWALGHVALPHIISVIAGIIFFTLGLAGVMGSMSW